jgi:hypothetical protein
MAGDLIQAGQYDDAKVILSNLALTYKNNRGVLDSRLEGIVNRQTLSKVKRVKHFERVNVDEEYKRARDKGFKSSFRVKDGTVINKVSDNPVANINWHFYKGIIKESGNVDIICKYRIEERFSDYNLVKELSTYALVNGPKLKGFNLLVGLDQLFGFNIDVKGMSSIKEIKEWVTEKFIPTLNGSESKFMDKFKYEVRRLLHWKSKLLKPKYNDVEYCRNIAQTGTSGSAFDPGGEEMRFTVFDEELDYMKNKFAKSGAISIENKLNRLYRDEPAKHKVNDKVEVYPKRRLIVSADYNLTLKMRFVDTWLSEWLSGNENSYLWRKQNQIEEMWVEFMNYRDKRWRVPLDQSSFDHHVSKSMVLAILDEIRLLLRNKMDTTNMIKEQYDKVMNSIIYGIKNAYLVYELREDDEGYVKGERKFLKIPYENGVLSGWQWTSKINTIANIAESRVAIEQIRRKGINVQMIEFDATGDDQNTSWKYLIDSLLYWLELVSYGFVIHPNKNFFSRNHNEYLRLYSTSEGINGYPARTINKILWIYPGNIEDNTFSGKLNNIYDRWKRLSLRARIKWSSVKDNFIRDIKGAKLPNDLIKTFLHGQVIYGGKGVQPIEKKTINYIPGTWLYHVHIHGSGFEQFKEFYGLGQRSEIDEWFLDACKVQDNNLKTDQNYEILDVEKIEPLEFALVRDKKIPKKPKLTSSWYNNVIFTNKRDVMNRAFQDIDPLVKNYNAPRSWVYDWLLGQVDVIYPEMDNVSKAGQRILGKKYENSVYYAMFMKRKKENKWLRLQKYFINSINNKISEQIGPKMFVL